MYENENFPLGTIDAIRDRELGRASREFYDRAEKIEKRIASVYDIRDLKQHLGDVKDAERQHLGSFLSKISNGTTPLDLATAIFDYVNCMISAIECDIQDQGDNVYASVRDSLAFFKEVKKIVNDALVENERKI